MHGSGLTGGESMHATGFRCGGWIHSLQHDDDEDDDEDDEGRMIHGI